MTDSLDLDLDLDIDRARTHGKFEAPPLSEAASETQATPRRRKPARKATAADTRKSKPHLKRGERAEGGLSYM